MSELFHTRTFELLHVQPSSDAEALAVLHDFEDYYHIWLPEAVKAWYGDAHAMPVMSELRSTFGCSPVWLSALGDLFARWQPVYAKTAPVEHMLPLLSEADDVWHLAVAVDGQADPAVYIGYRRAGRLAQEVVEGIVLDLDDLPAQIAQQGKHVEDIFEWHLHAHSFSQFVEAWVWDYLTVSRDYFAVVTPYIDDDDIAHVRSAFSPGPTTYHVGGIDDSERCERYYRDDQRIHISIGRKLIWFSAESSASMQALLEAPWSGGPLPDSLKNQGAEKLRWPRR